MGKSRGRLNNQGPTPTAAHSFCGKCCPVVRRGVVQRIFLCYVFNSCSRNFYLGWSRIFHPFLQLSDCLNILPIRQLHLTAQGLTRRAALLQAATLLALPASGLAAATTRPLSPDSPDTWPNASQVPGGIARLSLGPAATRPVAYAGDVPLLVLGDVRDWVALVGIPLAAKLGPASIDVHVDGGSKRAIRYTIAPKKYAEQRLSVAPGTVDLSPENEARYERERATNSS